MDCVIFSDVHAANFSSCNIVFDGIGSRLRNCISAIQQVKDYACREKVPYTFFLGDMFQSVMRLDIEVLNAVYAVLQNWPGRLFCLVGNHDRVDKKTHGLEIFKSFVRVIDKPELLDLDGDRVLMVPYTRKGCIKTIKRVKSDWLFLHQGLSDVPAREGLYLKEPVALGDLPRRSRIFSGHYHSFREVPEKSFAYVGSLLHRDWSDVGDKKSFLHIKGDKTERIYTQAPEFVSLSLNCPEDLLRQKEKIIGNYVRMDIKFTCRIPKIIEEALVLSALWAGVPARSMRESCQEKLSLDMSIEKLVADYAQRAPGHFKRKVLSEAGLGLLREGS